MFTISDARFVVVGDRLSLLAGETLDFETEPTVSLDVTATDPSLAAVVRTLVITVANVNESPTDLLLSSTSLVATAAVGDSPGIGQRQ